MSEQDQESEIVGYHGRNDARKLTDARLDIQEMLGPLHRNAVYEKIRERGIHVGGPKRVSAIR